MRSLREKIARHPLAFLLIAGMAIHLWKIGVDLPNNYYTDEPHHLNKAAAFGSGNLNPRDFKYPTLWSYTLAGMLGALYAGGKLLGVVSSSTDFAQKYLYNPGFFFFCGRALSTLFICLIPPVFFKLGERFYSRRFAWALALLALSSSSLSEFSLQAVPYSMLVFFAALSLYPLHAIFEGQGAKAFAALGFAIGLTVSSHYVAASYASLLLIAFFQRRPAGEAVRLFALGLTMATAGFFFGTPFLLLELKSTVVMVSTFLVGIPFLGGESTAAAGSGIFSNVSAMKVGEIGVFLRQYMDLWGVGVVLAFAGIIAEIKERRWRSLIFLSPFLGELPLMLLSFFLTHRYIILLTIPVYIFAARGVLALVDAAGASAWRRRAVVAGISCLMAASYFQNRRYITIPDTRTQAQRWIEKNVPAGEKVLTAGPYEGPQLMMARNQVERLYLKTKELKHPREVYFRTLLSGHPGGGYEVIYVKKSVEEILDLPSRTEKSFQAQEFIDVIAEGIAPLLDTRVNTVVILKAWEDVERHKRWISELRARYKMVASFNPEKNKVKGYFVEIYRNEPVSAVEPKKS